MKFEELKAKLKIHNVPDYLYSLDEGLKPNAYILTRNYAKWEFFYLNEKGERSGFIEFDDTSEAIVFFWQKIENELRYPPSIPSKGIFD